MKKFLYVWEDFSCDYTCGIAFAIASSADEARALLIAKRGEYGFNPDDLKPEPQIFPLNKVIAFFVTGGS